MSTKVATTEAMEIPKDKEDIDAWLRKKFLGCAKARKHLTKKERIQLALDHTEEDAKRISKEFGLKPTPQEELECP